MVEIKRPNILWVAAADSNLNPMVPLFTQAGYSWQLIPQKELYGEDESTPLGDLMVLELPELDHRAWALIENLDTNPQYQDTPLLVLGPLAHRDTFWQRITTLPSCDYLLYPLQPWELLGKIKIFLTLSRLQKPPFKLPGQVITSGEIIAFGQEEWQRSQRYGNCFCLMAVHFDTTLKTSVVNVLPRGEECAELVSQTLTHLIRAVDRIGRSGKQDFMIVLPETSLDKALILGERLRHDIVHLCPKIDQQVLNLSLSIGIAEFHRSDSHFNALVERAQRALAQAQAAGGNRVYGLPH